MGVVEVTGPLPICTPVGKYPETPASVMAPLRADEGGTIL